MNGQAKYDDPNNLMLGLVLGKGVMIFNQNESIITG
jgi:hypothetical protein